MDTRSNLLATALTAFVERGYDATTLQTIREQAGISNGSLFHFFRSKEALGAALYLEGILTYQHGLIEVLEKPREEAALGIKAMVRYHFQWVESNVELSRYLFERGRPDWGPDHIEAIRLANARTYRTIENWLTDPVRAGQLRQQPRAVAVALLQGATLALSRAWLEAPVPGKLVRHTNPLADSLWAAFQLVQETEK